MSEFERVCELRVFRHRVHDELLQVHRVHDELLEVGAASSARVAVDAAPQAPPGRRDELRRGHGDDGFVFFLSLFPFPLLKPNTVCYFDTSPTFHRHKWTHLSSTQAVKIANHVWRESYSHIS
jgi:hypothetical protein